MFVRRIEIHWDITKHNDKPFDWYIQHNRMLVLGLGVVARWTKVSLCHQCFCLHVGTAEYPLDWIESFYINGKLIYEKEEAH